MSEKDEAPIKTYELYEVVDNEFSRLVYASDCLEDMRLHLETLKPKESKE